LAQALAVCFLNIPPPGPQSGKSSKDDAVCCNEGGLSTAQFQNLSMPRTVISEASEVQCQVHDAGKGAQQPPK